jgi:alkyldihydroxyacetonephosphate synthase
VSGSRPDIPVPLESGAATRPSRLGHQRPVDDATIARLKDACAEVQTDPVARLAAGRDWWPLSLRWAVDNTAPSRPDAVCRPASALEVAAVLRVCHHAGVPVTALGGRSGVCGASLPVFGGVSLDMTRLEGITGVDDTSLLVDVRAGTFGDDFEERLRADHGLTVGHWPQSVALSTVGGWAACRGAGQYSTRYGKVEDMVAGLEVVLADGRIIRTGMVAPRAATGPDLTQLFVGSEGTLGVITEVRLRAHPRPPDERRAAYRFPDFAAGLDACRRVLRRGATPAVLRLYDEVESKRSFEVDGNVLIVLDEGDTGLIEAVMRVVADEAADAAEADEALVGRWLDHRNELPPLESLVRGGIVADTIEIAASWRALPGIYRDAIDGLRAIDATVAASAHQSHSYTDGACLYFTFAGRPDDGSVAAAETYYQAAWDAVMAATSAGGGTLSHHHGIGLNRGRYLPAHLGGAWDVLTAVKSALDPHQVLNPGKLGLPSPFGPAPWPLAREGAPSASL